MAKSPIFSYYFKAKFKYEFQIQKVTDHMTAHCKSCHMIELVEEGAIFGQILFEFGFLN